MLERTDLIYSYDGSFSGFLCCVFESFSQKEKPGGILGPEEAQLSLFSAHCIETEPEKAARVEASISVKIGPAVPRFLRRAFLTSLRQKELHMLEFLRLGYRGGPEALELPTCDTVRILRGAVRFLGNEVERYKGFVRFSDYGGVLAAAIQPKNYVLPFLGPHFRRRMPGEKFLIYDQSHKMLCAYNAGRFWVSDAAGLDFPEADAPEKNYRRLWRIFYDSIAISGRENPRCRMGHMPRRYWHCLTEMQKDTEKRPAAVKAGTGAGLLDLLKLQ